MKHFVSLIVWGSMMTTVAQAAPRDTRPDTWVATDGLGRVVSTSEQVGPPRKDKFVGIFYFLWMGQHGTDGPFDITKILAQDPDAMSKPDSPLWGPLNKFHYWGEPLFGYYLSTDKWVYQKHAQMLSDAGVDTVVFDVTNRFTYPESYTALCEAWTEVRRNGGRTPQIAFLTPFWDPKTVTRTLYDDFYSKNLYADLWFQWKGKPLILADPAKVDDDVKGFFTFRKPQPDYFQGPTGPNQWAWLEKYPQHVFYDSDNKPEQMVVGIAQNGHYGKLCTFSEKDTYGRSWHDGKKDERPGAVNLGLNFAEQWKRALEVDPEFIFITGWNEWIAMRLNEFAGVREPVMFCDQFTQEYSRDIEPMKGGHVDHYYYQMIDYIRRFKGARPAQPAGAPKTMRMDRNFADWRSVTPEYLDDIGDTAHRDHPGWGSEGQYVNKTGRNDLASCKVARDERFVYFYASTREPITPHTDPGWMMLFINSDRDHRTGWEGYDFVVNRKVLTNATTLLERSRSRWNWEPVTEVRYKVRGNEIEIAVSRSALGFDTNKPLRFDFKWADNTAISGDIMEFYTDGDVAPNGRFAYRYEER
jgi:hypothetical protein